LPLTGVKFGSAPIVLAAAVDPQNPDIVFMVSQAANLPSYDRVYRSTDAGVTFTEVLAPSGSVQNVVVTSTTVFVTTLIQSGNNMIGGPAYQSSDGGASFEVMANAPQLSCLAQRSDGVLIGCGANWDPDRMAVGKSSDNGATWQKIFRFVELNGPLVCPPGTAEYDVCAQQQWGVPGGVQQQFGATGPVCGANASEGAIDAPPVRPPKKSGCCETGEGAPLALGWTVGIALWLSRRRR
jgi:hypothetical protein